MRTVAQDIERITTLSSELLGYGEAAASFNEGAGAWSKKEILGHLIDSALNNHGRIVRLQLAPDVTLPGYAQDDWVRVQHYRERKWSDLVELWRVLNLHLAHVIGRLEPAAAKHVWHAEGGDYDLEFIVRDYLRHLQHHLDQILDNKNNAA